MIVAITARARNAATTYPIDSWHVNDLKNGLTTADIDDVIG